MTAVFVAGGREPLSYRRRLARQRRIDRMPQEAIQPALDSAFNVGGMRVAVRCRSADSGIRVGGDWYLATPVPDGDVVLAVGDVEGNGIEVVESMAGLR